MKGYPAYSLGILIDMTLREIIAKRRDGIPHTQAEIEALVAAAGKEPDYLLAAWLMAAYIHPLSLQEAIWLTSAMARSGETLDLEGLPKPWVDKHSTGGVGDKTTLILLPLLAACGLTCIKMSGRGLGITGGTIDKLESIPGFKTDLSPTELKRQAADIGLALTGQSPDLAPADKVLYALRDVTGTVASLPLIVSSILSKKIAGGAETIVLDVKAGRGAFMKTEEQARELAKWLTEVGVACGINTTCVLTDMDQPLGRCVGNGLEVQEALEVLSNAELHASTKRLRILCLELAAVVLLKSGLCLTPGAARAQAENALASGAALGKAAQWWAAQGATVTPTNFHPKDAPVTIFVPSQNSGTLCEVNAEIVGEVVVALGGGRAKKDDTIDHQVGIEVLCQVGGAVSAYEPLFVIHAQSKEDAQSAEAKLAGAIAFGPAEARPVIL